MSTENGFQIAGNDEAQEILDRMSRSILALSNQDFRMLGIRRRGVPLMNLLADRIESRTESSVPRGELELKRYADDLSVLHERPKLKKGPDLDVTDQQVVLVDDVLYTGRTMFRATGVLEEAGAQRVYPVTLCSRGVNDLPIHADVVGRQLDVGQGNVIEVHIPPYEDHTGIYIYHKTDLED